MPLIFLLLLLITQSFADVQCDPAEVEKQCGLALCGKTPRKIIPTDPDEFLREATSRPFTLSPEVKEDLEKMKDFTTKFQSQVRNMTEVTAEEMLKNPTDSLAFLFELANGEFLCVEKNRTCDLVTSDMNNVSPEMKGLIKEWFDTTYLFRSGIFAASINEKKKYLKEALSSMEESLGKGAINDQKKKIDRLEREHELYDYIFHAEWYQSYKDKVKSNLYQKKDILKGYLQQKIQALTAIDFGSEDFQKKVLRSCQIAEYLQDSMKEQATKEAFDKQVEKVLSSFRKDFLPALSESTARELKEKISSETFQLIQPKLKVVKGKADVGFPGERPSENTIFLDLIRLQNNQNYKCSIQGFFPDDHYNYISKEIKISAFVVANGYGDVVAHELGHWLSDQLSLKGLSSDSSKKLSKVRECVSSYYSKDRNFLDRLLGRNREHEKTEEDFADWFSAQLKGSESGVFCDMTSLIANLTGTRKPAYAPIEAHEHSSNLFREIAIRINRDEAIPQACRDLMNAYPNFSPKKCEMK